MLGLLDRAHGVIGTAAADPHIHVRPEQLLRVRFCVIARRRGRQVAGRRQLAEALSRSARTSPGPARDWPPGQAAGARSRARLMPLVSQPGFTLIFANCVPDGADGACASSSAATDVAGRRWRPGSQVGELRLELQHLGDEDVPRAHRQPGLPGPPGSGITEIAAGDPHVDQPAAAQLSSAASGTRAPARGARWRWRSRGWPDAGDRRAGACPAPAMAPLLALPLVVGAGQPVPLLTSRPGGFQARHACRRAG